MIALSESRTSARRTAPRARSPSRRAALANVAAWRAGQGVTQGEPVQRRPAGGRVTYVVYEHMRTLHVLATNSRAAAQRWARRAANAVVVGVRNGTTVGSATYARGVRISQSGAPPLDVGVAWTRRRRQTHNLLEIP